MLSDHERIALRQIQRDLSTQDPGLAQSFETTELSKRHNRGRHTYDTWIIVVTTILSLLSLAMGVPISATLFAAAAVVMALRQTPGADEQQDMQNWG